MTTAHTTTPLKIPARDLRKGDMISSGIIGEVELHEGYVGINFATQRGVHDMTFPLDLEVTVLSRGLVEVDVVAELTALADEWVLTAAGIRGEAGELDDHDPLARRLFTQADERHWCAGQLRELIGRLA